MSIRYRQHFSTQKTPQSQPIPGTSQVLNNAAGYSWTIDDWQQLDRWLLWGSEGGTYYVGEQKLTRDNAEATLRCIQADGPRAVARIVEISDSGRAPKNDPALFALAMAASLGDMNTRKAALASLPKIARTGTHLFHFLEYVEGFRGWGRALRNAVGTWYNQMDVDRLAYQIIKYQQRDGWSHRDLLRLAHPKPTSTHNQLYRYIVKGTVEGDVPQLVHVYEQAKAATDEQAIVELVSTYNLTWEFVPSQWLGSANVWRNLLPRLPMTALVRNLGRMTANELLKPMSTETQLVCDRLNGAEDIRRSRLHPLAVLVAMRTYAGAKGKRGSLEWQPVREVVDALDSAFYLSFANVEPTGKRIVFGLDVSGSMANSMVNGIQGLSARDACGVMALVSANVERNYAMCAFDTKGYILNISPRQRLDDVVRVMERTGGGGTDCAIPILWAIDQGIPADAFVILTDSETWSGRIHPAQAVAEYRRRTGIPAKLVVVAMCANQFSIGDANDPLTLQVVGFDTATPQFISQFIAG